MPVVNPIIFKVTDVGRDAAAYAFNNLPGGKLSLSAIKVGLAKYSTVGNETSLQNPLPNTFSIGGGGVQVGSGQIRFTPILASLTRIEAFEIGLFTETGILFAVAATPTNIPLLVIEPDIEAIFTMNVALTNVDPDSIEIVVDVNAPLAVVMMGQHISAAHPHSQYKRTHDASERLKVADGQSNDEAVSIGQLIAEATTRENYLKRAGLLGYLLENRNMPNDANLNNYHTENGKWYFTDSQFNRPFDFGVLEVILIDDGQCIQHAVSLLGKEASRYFNASNSDLGLPIFTDWVYRANGNGDNTLRFAVADAVYDYEAVSKGQLTTETTAREDGFKALGLGKLEFYREMSSGGSFDDYTESGKWYFTDSQFNRPFDFGVLEVQEITYNSVLQIAYSLLDIGVTATRRFGAITGLNDFGWYDWVYNATRNGDPLQRFKVADAIDNKDAVNKEELTTAVSTLKKNAINGLFGGHQFSVHTTATVVGTHSIPPNESIRVILIGGGAGGGSISSSGSIPNGVNGGDSYISTSINGVSTTLIKASGGIAGGGVITGSGTVTGVNAQGGEVELYSFTQVVILSYSDGLVGNFDDDTPIIKHPTVKHFSELDGLGRGGKGAVDGSGNKSGAGSSGAFVEAVIRNYSSSDAMNISIVVGSSGASGNGNAIDGQDGADGGCVVIHTYF